MDGIGISGWVEVGNDWKYVVVGNERLIDMNGGKVKTTAEEKEKINNFTNQQKGCCIILVVIEDEVELALALAGNFDYMLC